MLYSRFTFYSFKNRQFSEVVVLFHILPSSIGVFQLHLILISTTWLEGAVHTVPEAQVKVTQPQLDPAGSYNFPKKTSMASDCPGRYQRPML